MTDFLDGLASAFDGVIQTTLQATVLVVLVLVLQRLLGKRLAPRWHYALWLLVLIRLFLPWTPESPTSVFNFVRTENATPTQLLANPGTELVLLDTYVEISAVPPFTDPPNSFRLDVPELRVAWTDWLRLLWVSVAALLALYVCIVNGSLWWRVCRESAIDAGPVAAEFAECKQIMGVRAPIRLIRTRAVSTPALLGLLRPRLLLPESMERTLSREELRHVFLHELAHYRRGDLIVNWLMVACNIVHWFNPALWYAFHRMRADRELACDALAMSYIAPEETSSYGRTLLRLLEHVARPRPLPGLVGVMERRSHLKKRIRGIAGFKPGSYRWSILATGLIATLSAVGLTNASTNETAEDPPEITIAQETDNLVDPAVSSELTLQTGDARSPEDGLSAPALPVRVETAYGAEDVESVQLDMEAMQLNLMKAVPLDTEDEQDSSLQDVGGELQLATPENRRDLNVTLVAQSIDLTSPDNDETHDRAGLSEPPVLVRSGDGNTIAADYGHVDLDAMELKLSGSIVVDVENGEDVRVTDGTATLVLDGPKKGTLEDLEGDKIEVFKELPPESRDDMLSVEEDLDDESPRVRVEGESTALTADRMILDLETDEITLHGNVQGDIAHGPHDLRSGNLTFNLSAEGVSTNVKVTEAVSGEAEPAVVPSPNPEIMDKLEEPVSLEFEDEHIATIATFMATYMGVPIAIDDEAVAPKDNSSADGATYTTDGMVPYVKLENVPLKDALKAILRPLKLAYEARGDSIVVSTPDRLQTEAPPSVSETQSKLDDVMLSISIQEGTTLLEAAAKLADAAEINVIVDRRVVNADDGASSDPTVWVVRPEEFRDAPILDVLRAILDPLGLTFSVEPGFIWISSPDRIATESFEELETRVYSFSQIPALKYAETRESVLAAIRRIVLVTEPDTGRAISRVALQEEEGALIVYSAPSHLETLEKYLLNTQPARFDEGVQKEAADPARAPVSEAAAALPSSTLTASSSSEGDRFDVKFSSYRMSSRAFWKLRKGWDVNEDSSRIAGLQDDSNVYDLPSPAGITPENAIAGIGASSLGSQTISLVGFPRTVKPYGDGLLGFFFKKKNATGPESDQRETSDATKPHFLLPAGSQEVDPLRVYPQIAHDGERLRVAIAFIPDTSDIESAEFMAFTTVCDEWHAVAVKQPDGEYLVCFVRVERADNPSVA